MDLHKKLVEMEPTLQRTLVERLTEHPELCSHMHSVVEGRLVEHSRELDIQYCLVPKKLMVDSRAMELVVDMLDKRLVDLLEADIADVGLGLVVLDNTLWQVLLVPCIVVDKTELELVQRLELEQQLEEQDYRGSDRVLHFHANAHVLRFRGSDRGHHHHESVHDLPRHGNAHDHCQRANAHNFQLVAPAEPLAMEHTTLVVVEGKLVVVEVEGFG